MHNEKKNRSRDNVAKFFGTLFIIFVASGCLFGQKKEMTRPALVMHNEENFVVEVKRLKEGGRLAILPFKAGPNVYANAEVNRLGLYVYKGIQETLKQEKKPFVIINSKDIESADFVISGYVVRFDKTGGARKWIPGQNKIFFEMEGSLTLPENGRKVVQFSKKFQNRKSESDPEALAYSFGSEMAHFILDNMSDAN